MAPENLGKSGEVNCVFLQKLRNSDEVPRSADPQADRYKVLCQQNARPYRPLGLVDLDFHLLCVSEGLRIEVAGNGKELEGPPPLSGALYNPLLSSKQRGARA
jgi:hypothetical protein